MITREYRFSSSNTMDIFGQVLSTSIPVDDGVLLGNVTLEISLPVLPQIVQGVRSQSSYVKWSPGGVMMLIDRVEFVVNGITLQSFSGTVLDIESFLNVPVSASKGYEAMTGRGKQHDGLSPITYYLPIPFWFCRDGAYFPLCSLSVNNRVDIRFSFKRITECIQSNRLFNQFPTLEGVTCKLLGDIYHTTAKERLELVDQYRRKDFLIEEYQEQSEIIEPNLEEIKREILFSRSIKRLHWVLQDSSDIFHNTVLGNYRMLYDGWDQLYIQAKSQTVLDPPIKTAQLYFGSDEREPLAFVSNKTRVQAEFYTKINPYKFAGCNTRMKNYIYSYFFCLDPFKTNIPSGHYNFSTLTNFLHITMEPGLRRTELFLYSVGYNICRFENGQVELFFVD